MRGEGTRLWDADGNEYLDFLAGISVCNVGHCHPRGGGGGARAGRAPHARLEPLLHRAGDAARRSGSRESSLGGKVFFCNSGAEANEAAIKLARKAQPGGEIVVVARRLPRAHVRRAVGHAAGGQAGAVRAARARLRRPSRPTPAALEAAVDERTAAVLLEPIQGETGVHPLSDELLRGRARGLRPRRRAR